MKSIVFACLGIVLVLPAEAQKQLQDSFWLEKQWSNSVALGASGVIGFGVAVSTNQEVYVANGSQVVVTDGSGAILQTWSIASVRDVALHPNSNLVFTVASVTTSNHVKAYTPTGVLVRQWGTNGSGAGQFNNPRGIAVATNGNVYVADTSNHRIEVFDSSGNFIRQWGQFGTASGDFKSPADVAIGPDGSVYVADYTNARLQRFDPDGNFLGQFTASALYKTVAAAPDGLLYAARDTPSSPAEIFGADLQRLYVFDYGAKQYPDTTSVSLHAGGFSPDGQQLYLVSDRDTRVFRRGYRTTGLLSPNALPLPLVHSVVQRPGTMLVDVDYTVFDADNPNVAVAAIAMLSGRKDLKAAVRMATFIEGTDVNVGSNITTGVKHRLTWSADADWQTNFANVKINILAKDNRGLIDFHFLTIPSNATYNTQLRISRTPLLNDDYLGVWTWLVATGSPGVNLVTGDVYGTSGVYSNVLLAQTQGTNTVTTSTGRDYIYSLLSVREATSDEVTRAKVATTPGIVSRWDPRVKVGDLPQKINEYGFDTGLFTSDPNFQVTNAWWVVPLP